MRSIMAAIFSIAAVGTGIGISGPLLSLLMEADGLSSVLIGANTAIAGVAAMIAVPFATPLARAIGVVNALVLNILIAALCLIAFYFTDPVPHWFTIRLVFSFNLSMVFILSEFWINASANDSNRGLVLGIYATVLSIGFAIGPSIVALVGTVGITPFAIGGIVIALASTPILIASDGS